MWEAHTSVVRDTTRVQNRIKALFRSRGIHATNTSVYTEKGRETWLEQLPQNSRASVAILNRSTTGWWR